MTSSQTQHNALLDELLKGCSNPQDILGEHGLVKQLTGCYGINSTRKN